MGNCLITKLKENVQNENLSKLNEILVSISSLTSEQAMYIKGIERIVAYGDGYFKLSQDGEHKTESSINPSNLTGIYIPANIDFKLGFYSKYNLNTLSGNSLNEYRKVGQYNISDVKYCQNIQYLTIDGVGNLKDLSNHSKLVNLCLSSHATGDIADLSTCTSLSKFVCNENYSIYGNVSSIGNLKNLSQIELTNTSITGKVEEFVAEQVLATRTTGTINWIAILRHLSFGNIVAGTQANSMAPYYLKWESASKIWIEGVLAPDTNRIWCMGYTQSEAETKWPDKTIITADHWNNT